MERLEGKLVVDPSEKDRLYAVHDRVENRGHGFVSVAVVEVVVSPHLVAEEEPRELE